MSKERAEDSVDGAEAAPKSPPEPSAEPGAAASGDEAAARENTGVGSGRDSFDFSADDERIGALETEVAELKDAVLRARAETENVRRRAEKDRADASAYAVTGFARDMLTVSDNLRRALDALPAAPAEDMKSFVEGVELTERELLNTLERHHITKLNPEPGAKFDPAQHQAMFEMESADHPAGSVVQVVASGYQIKDRLLRPAMVGVAKAAKGPAKLDTKA